jgi:hypothetical protein
VAGNRFRVRATPSANDVIGGLRSRARQDYANLELELKTQGCKAAGYRLLASSGEPSEVCCKHLAGLWRVVTTFEPGVVWVVAVGQHDGPVFYRNLAKDYEIGAIGQRREHRPGCCGDDGWPSLGETAARRRTEPSARAA